LAEQGHNEPAAHAITLDARPYSTRLLLVIGSGAPSRASYRLSGTGSYMKGTMLNALAAVRPPGSLIHPISGRASTIALALTKSIMKTWLRGACRGLAK
jgi:hypothetical protein